MPGQEFDWQLGEDNWDDISLDGNRHTNLSIQTDTPDSQSSGRPTRWRRRVVLIPLLIIGLLIAAVSLIVARRVDEATAPIVKDVLATHTLVQRAMANSDAELLDKLLAPSGRNTGWDAVQRGLLEQASPFDRGPLGLHLQTAEPQGGQVNLSADLKEAEVVTELAYTVYTGSGVTETVRLRQTVLYRFENQRWLLSSPGYHFWGDSLTSAGRRLDLTYPERDEEIGKRLARDLDSVLGKLCGGLADIECPVDYHVQAYLERWSMDLVSMLRQGTTIAYRPGSANTVSVDLPAPTLVGLPVDEAGYQALYRGYAVQLVQAVVNDLVSQQSYGRVVAPLALNRILVEMGLRPWPPAAVANSQGAPPLELPDQDIVSLCLESITHGGSLYRYRPAADTWIKELPGNDFVSLSGAPDDDGVILQEQIVRANQVTSRIARWRNGDMITLLETPANAWPTFDFGLTRPPDKSLLIATFDDNSNRSVQGPTAFKLIDLSACTAQLCESKSITGTGYPTWSPDGSQLIVWETDGVTLYRADDRGRPLAQVGDGAYPFWLDNRAYGYVRWRGIPGGVELELVTARVSDDKAQVLLRQDDFQSALPENDRANWSIVGLGPVAVSPADSDLLLIAAYATKGSPPPEPYTPGRSYVFLFDRRTGAVSARIRSEAGSWFSFTTFSPTGRWLVTSEFDRSRSLRSVILHDIARSETKTIQSLSYGVYAYGSPSYDWSSDGQWLLVLDDGVLRLIAPEHDYERAIVPDAPGCEFAAWVNR